MTATPRGGRYSTAVIAAGMKASQVTGASAAAASSAAPGPWRVGELEPPRGRVAHAHRESEQGDDQVIGEAIGVTSKTSAITRLRVGTSGEDDQPRRGKGDE
jgi:hypothetical protein